MIAVTIAHALPIAVTAIVHAVPVHPVTAKVATEYHVVPGERSDTAVTHPDAFIDSTITFPHVPVASVSISPIVYHDPAATGVGFTVMTDVSAACFVADVTHTTIG